jgi:hypothetical protein
MLNKSATRDFVSEALGVERPLPLIRAVPAADPFPVEALGSQLSDAAFAVQDRVQCPMAICGQSVLAAAALAVQALADIRLPHGAVRPISNFFLTIAGTGERKSTSDDLALRAFRERENDLRVFYDAEMIAYERDRLAWEKARDNATKHKTSDRAAVRAALDAVGEPPLEPLKPFLTCEEPNLPGLHKLFLAGQPSMGIFSAEGGHFIGGNGMTPENKLATAAGLSAFWDGVPVKRVRAGDGATHLVGRRLSMHLMLQPEVADLLLSDSLMQAQGLLSRFLMTAPATTKGTRFHRREANETTDCLANFTNRLLATLAIKPMLRPSSRNELQPRQIALSAEALAAWPVFYNGIEKMMGIGMALEPVSAFANKLPEHACRLAAVLALIENPCCEEISIEHFRFGCELVEHYAEEALWLQRAVGVNSDLAAAEKLRKWLLRPWDADHIGLRQIVRFGPGTIRDTATARRLARILQDHGWLKPLEGGTTIKDELCREAWEVVRRGADGPL